MAIGTATAIIGGSLIAGAASLIGSDRAADAQVAGNDAAIAEQRRQFDTVLQLLEPQRQIGNDAINQLSRLFGFSEPTPRQGDIGSFISRFPTREERFDRAGTTSRSDPNAGIFPLRPGGGGALIDNETGNELFLQPDGSVRAGAGQGRLLNGGKPQPGPDQGFGGPNQGSSTGLDVFQESPDFEFRRGEGLEGIAQTLGAGGVGAFSGNALRELNIFNSNLASGEFGDFVNRRLALAGLGQTASSQAGSAAISTGANVGNALINQGNARQSGILGGTAAIGGTIKDIIEALVSRNTRNDAIDSALEPIFNNPGLF